MVQKYSWLVVQGPFILWLMHSNFLLRDFRCQVACSEMYADDMLQLVFTIITALPLQGGLKPAIGKVRSTFRDARMHALECYVLSQVTRSHL